MPSCSLLGACDRNDSLHPVTPLSNVWDSIRTKPSMWVCPGHGAPGTAPFTARHGRGRQRRFDTEISTTFVPRRAPLAWRPLQQVLPSRGSKSDERPPTELQSRRSAAIAPPKRRPRIPRKRAPSCITVSLLRCSIMLYAYGYEAKHNDYNTRINTHTERYKGRER